MSRAESAQLASYFLPTGVILLKLLVLRWREQRNAPLAGIAEASLHTTSDFFSIQEKQAEQEAGVDGSQRHPGGNS